jgi:CDP-glycerol glycerophosphotransferase
MNRPTGTGNLSSSAMAPTLTVVVIVYNDARRLRRAVRSVQHQSLADLEIVIVDDASTDDTPEVAARLVAADPRRVRYHRLPTNSGGCSAPRNEGIELAKGR